jgi:hypothetical protein
VSDGTLVWTLDVTGDGTVSFDVDNCYRGPCPGDAGAEPGAERRSYTITVEP